MLFTSLLERLAVTRIAVAIFAFHEDWRIRWAC